MDGLVVMQQKNIEQLLQVNAFVELQEQLQATGGK
jgi:hypothetical protein